MIAGLLRHRELMTSPAVTVTPDDTLERAARLMYTRRVKRLPVIDANGHLIGIIGRADLLAVFDHSDEDIRREILDQVIRHVRGVVAVRDRLSYPHPPEFTEGGFDVVARFPID
jgi:CBS-domain-containing membrane protein